MTEKLKKPQRELTDNQKAFVQAYTTPGKGLNNASQAYKIAYPNTKAGHNKLASRLMANDGIRAAIVAIQTDLAVEAGFTREKQLKGLELAKLVAASLKNPSAMVSAIREQNEMLGYHRELAPNVEKEARKRAKTAEEQRRAQEYAAHRTAEEAKDKPRVAKIGREAG